MVTRRGYRVPTVRLMTFRRVPLFLAASTASLAAAALAVVAVVPAAATSGVDDAAPAPAAGLQQALDDVVAAGAVGALAEVRDGRATWRGSSGVARIGGTTPVPTRGRFRAGSVTKTFLATVVLQLVAERRIGLDDRLAALLPRTAGVVPGAERITVRELLTHTSGLGDFMGDMPLRPPSAFLDVRWKTWDHWEMVTMAASHPVTPPGRYRYSNAGYLLLGMVVERVTGHSYGSEIRHRVIDRLGLRGTTMPGTHPVIHGPHPHGYLPVEQEDGTVRPVDLSVMNPSVFGAAGEIVSTTTDLNRFFAALLDGRLVRRDLLTLMKTPPTGSTYGLGLRKRTLTCGVTAYGNDGDALVYLTYAFVTADGDRQVTVSLTPWGPDRNSTDDAVDALLDRALCP
jgi:D-alanyl-D-alanine carboxypeptidase